MKEVIFQVIGGLGLFLFGMGLMSDGLKKVAGSKLRRMLETITKHRVIAVLVGAMVTCFVQSSSATTVMTVGFVNAGLLTLKQALCVILGANVGTTLTAWLVSLLGIGGLKITAYALPAVGVGFLLGVVGKNQKWKSIGAIMLGFGLLFIGIDFMKDAFGPLKESPQVMDFMLHISEMPMMPLIAVLAGTIMTVFLQSSSASIAMVQLMAFEGLFGTEWSTVLAVTIPFILGDNIGTTITAQLSALRTSRNAKRVAWGHTVFNALGVCYILPIVWFGLYSDAIIWAADHVGESVVRTYSYLAGTEFKEGMTVLSRSSIMVYIAIAHTLFNVVNVLVFIPLIGLLEKVVLRILPVREEEAAIKPVVLEEHLLSTPELALEQSKRAMVKMSHRCHKAFHQSLDGLLNNEQKSIGKALKNEDLIDDYQEKITTYLVELSQRQLSELVSKELPVLLHTVNDLERVGDHAKNIAELAMRKTEHKMVFSDMAVSDIKKMAEQIEEMFDCLIRGLGEENLDDAGNIVRPALENEKNLNRMQLEFRRNHVERMGEGDCGAQTGILFIDTIDNIEKIGDHLTNIVQSVIGGLYWDGVEPVKDTKEGMKVLRK